MPRAKSPRKATSSKKTTAAASAKVQPANGSTFQPEVLQEEIRVRAYELYEQRGCTPGRESEDWLLAEQEVAARYQNVGALAHAAGKD